jgi:hypothetical protein
VRISLNISVNIVGNPVMLDRKRENEFQERLILLREKLLKAGIRLDSYRPGQYHHLTCPEVSFFLIKSLFFLLNLRKKFHNNWHGIWCPGSGSS